jgi:tetratricopeptide (TPR) repeat protein
VVLGERERAAALYHQMLKAVATGTVLTLHGHHRLLQTAAGIAAAAGGQWERAEQHFETALRQAEEIPFRCEQAEARRWFAHMLLDRDAPGDAARARRYLDEAIVIYRQIGMPKHVELAAGLLQR